MLAHIFAVIAPILLCAMVGMGWAKAKLPYDGEFVSRIVMLVGAPCLIVATFNEVEIDSVQLLTVAGITALGILFLFLSAFVMIKLLKEDIKAILPPLVFPNCGNMGLPLCFFAFGEQGLALALIVFMVMIVFHFAIGVALVSGAHPLDTLVRSPVFYAALLSILLVLLDWRLPLWLANTISLLGDMSIPLMLVSLGTSLVELRITGYLNSLVLAGLRLAIGLFVGYLVIQLFALEGIIRSVILIQFAMPAAVFNYMLALRYDRSPQRVAGLVVVSTVLSFVSLPLLMWLTLY